MNWFQRLFCSSVNVESEPTPTHSEMISGSDVFNLLINKFQSINISHIYLSDAVYWLCSEEDIKRFLAYDHTNRDQYISEQHDCDDFSYRLMGQLSNQNWSGIAVGIIWTDTHAFNIFIDDKKIIYFIEPQTDEITTEFKQNFGNEIILIVL